MTTIETIAATIAKTAPKRSAWDRGTYIYAVSLLDIFRADYGSNAFPTMDTLLNGSEDWKQYSWAGCALIRDADIARALCSPSELRRYRNGERRPNRYEQWLDVQARALCHAAELLLTAADRVKGGNVE